MWPVGRNLASGLRSLRYPDRVRRLWVDAVCINQKDVNERNQQVRLMGQIYSTAVRVIVWLGEASTADLDIIRIIQAVGKDQDLHWLPYANEALSLKLSRFLNKSWWSRIWTAQEAILAKDLIYWCGDLSFPGVFMGNMLSSFTKHITTCCREIEALWAPPFLEPIFGVVAVMERMQTFETLLKQRACCSFPQLLVNFRYRNATDPRDKMYGIFGLVDDIDRVSIRYDLPVTATYELFTREILTKTGSLDLLSHLTHRPVTLEDSHMYLRGRHFTQNLPSWVPDWDRGYHAVHNSSIGIDIRVQTLSLYIACGSHLVHTPQNDGPGCLRVRGMHFDIIDKIGQAPSLSVSNPLGDILQSWRGIAGIDKQPNNRNPSGGTNIDAFWRTICLDLERKSTLGPLTYQRASAESQKRHDRYWLMELRSLYQLPGSMHRSDIKGPIMAFRQLVLSACYQRRFFVSKQGYFGLAPANAKEGDLVCILAGGRLPFILRQVSTVPTKENCKDEEYTFQLLGDGYVHGAMDGEIVKTPHEDEAVLSTFILI